MTSQYVRILRMVAIMPLKDQGYDFLVTKVLLCYCIVCGIVHFGIFATYEYLCLQQGAIELDHICEMDMVIGYVVRYWIVVFDRRNFLEIHNDCRAIWDTCTTAEHWTVHSYVKKVQAAFKCYFVIFVLTGVFYTFTALTTKVPPTQPNGTDTRILPVKFLLDGWEPSAGYAALFMLQVLVIHTAFIIALGIDTASPFIIMFTCGYFRILQERFFLIENGQKQKLEELEPEICEKVVACSKLHQDILKLCVKIKKFTDWLFLVQLLCTGYNLSIIGIKLAGPDPDKYKFITTFLVCLIELFLVQWTPDILLEESEAVATAAYCAYSFRTNPRIGKILLIVMQRARRLIQLTAGGIIGMSIESFGTMLTNALSFFTVLRNLNV